MTVADHYKMLGSQADGILNTSIRDYDLTLFSSNHSFSYDFGLWLEILKERPEIEILKNAAKEYQISLFSCILGLYQQAYMGLRFFLERTLAALLFSSQEIELNLWKMGERDTYWSEIIDENKGIFSKKFCKAFFPELKDEVAHFDAITKKVYRECSEFVHGNQSVLKKIPNNLKSSEVLFKDWNTKADVIKRIILFTCILRYLKHLSEANVKSLESTIAEEFKGIHPITEVLNK